MRKSLDYFLRGKSTRAEFALFLRHQNLDPSIRLGRRCSRREIGNVRIEYETFFLKIDALVRRHSSPNYCPRHSRATRRSSRRNEHRWSRWAQMVSGIRIILFKIIDWFSSSGTVGRSARLVSRLKPWLRPRKSYWSSYSLGFATLATKDSPRKP